MCLPMLHNGGTTINIIAVRSREQMNRVRNEAEYLRRSSTRC